MHPHMAHDTTHGSVRRARDEPIRDVIAVGEGPGWAGDQRALGVLARPGDTRRWAGRGTEPVGPGLRTHIASGESPRRVVLKRTFTVVVPRSEQ